jgi:hypothetical protein
LRVGEVLVAKHDGLLVVEVVAPLRQDVVHVIDKKSGGTVCLRRDVLISWAVNNPDDYLASQGTASQPSQLDSLVEPAQLSAGSYVASASQRLPDHDRSKL